MTGAPSLIDVFRLRVWAHAQLWACGEYLSLQTSVDELQAMAESYGLIEQIGQDAVQRIVDDAFTEARRRVVEIDVAEETDIYRAADVERTKPPRKPKEPRVAETVVEALALSLQTHGMAALQDRDNQLRLVEMSVAQIESLIVRLARAAVDDETLALLAELLP